MAKKAAPKKAATKKSVASKNTAAKKKPAAAARTSGVRNSPIPKKLTPSVKPMTASASQQRVVTSEMITQRAYEISQSPHCSGELDNWLRAERELRGI